MKTNQERFLLAIARIEKLSPAPLILARAMKLLREPESDVSSIASLVGRDPALVADIIRCANSVYYGGGEPTQTIDEAVQKIGFRETIKLLNLAVSRIVAGRDLDSYGISADDFWAESLFNGIFLRKLATATGCAEADDAYTVGLLRFLGRLAINQSIQDLGGGLFWRGDEPLAEWEKKGVGFVQAQAGAILLAKWQFPQEMVDAIAGQDAPALLTERNWLAEALYFTSQLLPQGLGVSVLVTEGADLPPAPVDSNFMQHYGLTPSTVEELLSATSKDYEQIRDNIFN